MHLPFDQDLPTQGACRVFPGEVDLHTLILHAKKYIYSIQNLRTNIFGVVLLLFSVALISARLRNDVSWLDASGWLLAASS